MGESTVRLILTCLDADECTVSFEPEGAVVTLERGHKLVVEITGPGEALPEVSYIPDGIVVGAWQGARTAVWDETGAIVEI